MNAPTVVDKGRKEALRITAHLLLCTGQSTHLNPPSKSFSEF